jgi:V/A-type H+-transporting ATPase subunit A
MNVKRHELPPPSRGRAGVAGMDATLAERAGRVTRVTGPVVEIEGLEDVSIFELVRVGPRRLPGEVTAIREGVATVQVYEYAGGLRPGDEVLGTGNPLSAPLGPGLLGRVFDGVLRRLDGAGAWLAPGLEQPSDQAWAFTPTARAGADVAPGHELGRVAETATVVHRILVPPGVAGRVDRLAAEGTYRPDQVVAVVGGTPVRLVNPWPVRWPRPVRRRLQRGAPLITGQRALDVLYPVRRGGTVAVPGGFGTGKTVLLQQVAKWCDADVIVYVGCGERGNEMADVLEEFPRIEDPRSGRSLMERTVIIANTSNMPVMAREASVYSGVTVAEYFRDLGLDAVVISDSTSRWAEAMREFASRTDQLPAEEGYPASLASAMAAFYERAGSALTLGGQESSVTLISAISPPGGDVTEPVTSHTTRFVRGVWSLDRDLASARHYPAVSWRDSFSRDAGAVAEWHAAHDDPEWGVRRSRALALLTEADRLESVAQLVGVGALPDRERATILAARLMREAVLQQSALSPRDASCAPAKQAALVEMVLAVHERCLALVARGVAGARLEEFDFSSLVRAREEHEPGDADGPRRVAEHTLDALEELA